MTIPVQITEKAITEIRFILKKKGIPKGYGLRMSVVGSRGCAGINYSLGFDKEKDGDVVFHIQDITIYIQKREMMFLIGKTVDYYEGSDAKGFLFTEDEAKST